MSEILQINMPVAPKNYNILSKPVNQGDEVFDLVDLARVIKTSDRTEQYKQENSNFDESNSLIIKSQVHISKNSSFLSSSLKSLIGSDMLSAVKDSGNTALLEKLNTFASEIMLSPDTILADLSSQQGKMTLFYGELFDLLRQINSQTINVDIKSAIQNLLKSISTHCANNEIISSLSDNLKYLSEQLKASPTLSQNLKELADKFSSPDAKQNFETLKPQVLAALKGGQNSLLLTDKLKNLMLLTSYNLSRFNSNPSSVKDSFNNLLSFLSNQDLKDDLKTSLDTFLNNFDAPNTELTENLCQQASEFCKSLDVNSLKDNLSQINPDLTEKSLTEILSKVLPESSKNDLGKFIGEFDNGKDLNLLVDKLSLILNSIENVNVKIPVAQALNNVLSRLAEQKGITYNPPNSMESMVSFISKNINDNALNSLQGFNQGQLLGGLLTAPGAFTPLCHYLVPLTYENTKAFGELWTDNSSTDDDDDCSHLFLSFNVENLGDFELELQRKNTDLSLSLLCPPDLTGVFEKLKGNIQKITYSCGYSSKNMIVGPLVKKHTLTDIFPKILDKRSGLNVTI